MQILARKLKIFEKQIDIVYLGEISEVKTGLDTGDNQTYLYKGNNANGPYKSVNTKKILHTNELNEIINNSELRKQIIHEGIPSKLFDKRTLIPFDKGGGSDMDAKRLSNYFSPTKYFVDWSEDNVKKMTSMTIADRMRNEGKNNIPAKYERSLAATFRNLDYHFKFGITFPKVGIPLFKLNSGGIFNTGGNCLFIKKSVEDYFTNEYLLGILCTKFAVYLIKNFINNSVNTQVDDMKEIPIPIANKKDKRNIEKLVSQIIQKQKKELDYPYRHHEQVEIEKNVYDIFGFSESKIEEIENWYYRKYPHLK